MDDGKEGAPAPGAHLLTLGSRTVVLAERAMLRVFKLLKRLAACELPVLIHGETGVGKENAAWAVHYWSRRAAGPFVALNCATLPESLVESELFGYERGAFSGADRTKKGYLESASGGTLFLDEVAELPLPAQAKFLRALDQRAITPLGDVRARPVDVRIVAATHRTLREEVRAGRFRQDLYHRISAAEVVVPPLRERPRELLGLAQHFFECACERWGMPGKFLAPAVQRMLCAYPWPGNVRELKNVVEFLAATVRGPCAEAADLPRHLLDACVGPAHEPALPPAPAPGPRGFRPIGEELRELQRQRMLEALAASGGNQARAAALICMPRRTFVTKLKQFGLSGQEVCAQRP